MSIRRPRRALLTAVLLAGGLLATPVATQFAHAQSSVCRGDPLVTLSNGRVYDLAVDITDSPSDVQSINFTLIGPYNVHVVSIIRDNTVLAPKEHFTYLADNDPGIYDAQIRVDTGNNAPVASHFYLANASSTALASTTVRGWSGDDQESRFFDHGTPQTYGGTGSSTPLPYTQPQPTTLSAWINLLTAMFGAVN